MPTIAELQINLDSRPVEQGTAALVDFANAADRASKAGKGFNKDTTSGGGLAPASETNKVTNLSEAIDAQTRKLGTLAEQRKKLESSGMKSTMPTEYERLNRIIDANIAKVTQQGNAVDQLNTKRGQDFLKAEKQAAAELRVQDRITDAAVRQENIVSRAAARQQREIETTINGLSRQIKAQTDYNNTIEKLNRARVIGSNGNMGKDGGISGGEYESYVKLAQAKRDAALATADNSREVIQAQNKLATYTATLGRVERAEVEYTRAIGVLNQAQKLGLVTIEQYDAKMAAFAAKRDAAVTAANDNSVAEQKYARELRSVMTAYDPVLRAQDQYNASVKILSGGLQTGVISVEQFNKALTEQRTALDGVKSAQGTVGGISSEYDQALRAVLPYRTELANLEVQQRRLDDAKKAGLVTTPQQVKDYDEATAAIKRQTAEYQKRIKEGQNAGISFKQEQAAMRGLPAQFTDIVVSLQGGQAPLTVLLQQGGQIKDMFGGIVPALKAMGTGLMALITPASVVGTAIAALGAAAYSGSQEFTAFNKAIIQTGNVSGVSASQFSLFREDLDRTTTTAGKAAEALTLIAAGGKVAGDMFEEVATAAILMEKATGVSMDKTIDDFNALGKDPVDAAVRLDEKYRFLTASVLAQADALVKQGKETEAVKLLQHELAEASTDTATRMIEQAGFIERAWVGVKDVVSETWDALKSIGRDDTTGDRMIKLLKQKADLEGKIALNKKLTMTDNGVLLGDTPERLEQTNKEIEQLQLRIKMEQYGADQEAATERRRRDSVSAQSSAQKRYESGLKGISKAENDLLKVRQENEKIKAGGNVTAEQNAIMTANEAKAVKDLVDAKDKANKPKHGALDTNSIQEVKSNLDLITTEYEGYYKRVTALGDAHLVSDEATYYSQKAILEAQRDAVSKSYDQQIEAIKNLQGNKKNSAAQNISLNNQLTKAEADRVIAMEKVDTKLDALQSKEKGRLEERQRNISSYKASLDSQLEGLVDEGARNADGVGRGTRQAGLSKRLAEEDRSFSKQQLSLSKQLSQGMDPEEYATKLKYLKDAHSDMTAQIIANDKDIQKANYEWTNGYTSAVENAADAGMNFAGTVEQSLSGAFRSAGDALGEFVTTGKLNFKSFAASILADMAKISAQQAASGALGGIFGLVGTAASAYFGGGANGFASGSAAATSSAAGASQAGYMNLSSWQAQGGAWSGGTQMFANGGAFTNSVVSSPTSFGMANGARGIMGEAGDEAIVPLARTRNGDLGVRMSGGGSGGGNVVNVNVNVTESGTTSNSDGGSSWNQFGSELGTFVDQKVYTIINNETRPGGSLQSQGGR